MILRQKMGNGFRELVGIYTGKVAIDLEFEYS
jgi:hypothetical protein